MYDGKNVYSNDYGYGLRKNGEKYTIKCTSGYAGKPEIVCKNGKWSWNSTEGTDNYCYKGGCNIDNTEILPVAGRHIINDRYTFGSNGYNGDQTIVKDGVIVNAMCESGYVSNQDTKYPKVLKAKCVNGIFTRTIDDVKYGDACVRGCVYGDTSMGWTDEMMANTVESNYTQYYDAKNTKNDWGTASIGEHAVRIDTKANVGALLYKNCATGYKPAGTGTVAAVNNSKKYPLIKCSSNGKWSQNGTYYMGCKKDMEYCPSLATVANGSISYSDARAMGSTAILACNSGYSAAGTTSITCNASGNWSGTLGDCKRNCISVSYDTSIKICTKNSSSDCYYNMTDTGKSTWGKACNLKGNAASCKVNGTVTLSHGTSTVLSKNCKFVLYEGNLGGGDDIWCVDKYADVNYKVTCNDGSLSVSKP